MAELPWRIHSMRTIFLNPMSRRNVLSLLFSLFVLPVLADNVPKDANLVALFADLHITAEESPSHQRSGFMQCVQDVLACNPRPANVLFYGDLSFNIGVTNDYRRLKELVKPLEDAGIRWTACFGNHDRREPFFAVFPEHKCDPALVPDRLVSVVRTPHADFILLDSCLEGPVNGGLDDRQREWLQKTLAQYKKPVFVGAHHPIRETGIADLMALNEACSGYVYGHNHAWKQDSTNGVKTLCLPSTGHWGDIGYVLVKLDHDGAVFTLYQRDYYSPRPAAKPEDVKPEWKQRVQKNNGSQWCVKFNKTQ